MKNIIAILFVFISAFASSQTQYIGAPNTTVVARGNFKVDSILYLPKRQKTPTDTGALRYQISDSSLYVWTGNAWRKAKNDGTVTSVSAGTGMSFATITSSGSVSADTNVLATKAYKQKGDDSLGAIIATKGTGTVTSVASGYGINGGTITTTGTLTADTLNLATRLRLQKVGDSLGVLISNAGGGTVTGVSAGIGMSFATITSSGAVNADTAILSTKAWRQKGVDSVASRLGLYLPLTGGTLTGGLTGTTGAFTSSGSGNTFSVTHSSGSGIGLNIEKGGNGEGLYVNKTSGTGNAATIIGTLNATTLVKSGGTSSQYLMADGTTSTLTNPVTGTGTTNRMAKFTASGAIGNSQVSDDGSTVLVGQAAASTDVLQVNGNVYRLTAGSGVSTALKVNSTNAFSSLILENEGVSSFLIRSNSGSNTLRGVSNLPMTFLTNDVERMRIFANGRLGINTTSDAGYQLDVAGTLRNTTGANFATSSGSVGIGYTSTNYAKVRVHETAVSNFQLALSNAGTYHTALVASAAADVLSDGDAWAMYGGPNNYLSGTNLGVGIGLGVNVPFFRVSRHNNFNSSAIFELMRITSAGDMGVGTNAPSYKLDISGTLRNTTSAYFATTSGSVGIGNVAPSEKLHVTGRIRATTIDSTATGMNMLYSDANGVIKKAAVPSGGSGSVTSITAGTGLTGGTITTSGAIAVDTASIATRARVQKGIDSVASLTSAKVGGTGLSGYFPKWTGTSTQDTSQLFQLGRNIGIGTATPTYRIHLPDAGNTSNQAMIAGSVFGSDGNGQTITPSSGALTYYGQGGVGYLYGAQVSSAGHWGVNTRSLNDATFNVDGSVKIVTIDSTSTARNMLYQDANGVIKKSAVPSGLTMADDVMTASGSWVATKDAGSGVTINNVAYTTNGTTKMVTIDGNFYIASASFSDGAWNEIGTIPAAYRPSKTVNWNSNFIVSGAEYERSDNTDFTGALSWTYGQMRIKDDGKVEVNASVSSNSIAAGGTAYIIVTFTQSYIIK